MNYMLKIEKPCGQDWSSMNKTSIGKFCSHCSKSVIDFTQLTDNEVLQIAEQHSGSLCGRLTQEQLNKVMQLQQQSQNNSRIYKIIAGLLMISTAENLLANGSQHLQKELVFVVDNKNETARLKEEKSEPKTDDNKNIAQGTIIDSDTKEPVPFATILIKGTKTGTTSDIEGKFKLLIPDDLLTDKISLMITSIGYELKELVFDRKDLPITKDIIVVPAQKVLMGEVIVVKKKKWWQRRGKRVN